MIAAIFGLAVCHFCINKVSYFVFSACSICVSDDFKSVSSTGAGAMEPVPSSTTTTSITEQLRATRSANRLEGGRVTSRDRDRDKDRGYGRGSSDSISSTDSESTLSSCGTSYRRKDHAQRDQHDRQFLTAVKAKTIHIHKPPSSSSSSSSGTDFLPTLAMLTSLASYALPFSSGTSTSSSSNTSADQSSSAPSTDDTSPSSSSSPSALSSASSLPSCSHLLDLLPSLSPMPVVSPWGFAMKGKESAQQHQHQRQGSETLSAPPSAAAAAAAAALHDSFTSPTRASTKRGNRRGASTSASTSAKGPLLDQITEEEALDIVQKGLLHVKSLRAN